MLDRSDPPIRLYAILTVPGLENSGPAHWQSLWEDSDPACTRVELGQWDRPHRNSWVRRLNEAIAASDRPVLLAAHSLGCHAVAWWSSLEPSAGDGKVAGALLVAPPAVEYGRRDPRLAAFAPLVRERLPFPSILAASQDDPYVSFGRAAKMARHWGSRLADAGWVGHINADSDLGHWPYGRFLLSQLAAAGAALGDRAGAVARFLPSRSRQTEAAAHAFPAHG
ncbi:RBBP9/YdeN family alpha/beta hydrolase [Sphingopyxis indica]|uniref:Esterase n=1 Tax=Sphingopyxis indica TaxID=436663 RepID=A0A239JT47_9SPHN|nr:alpha/beta hydrolase [Sphingopyxis indica]SNT09057.1 hypothetical protein SAMN06295955_11163 [Sphingopyxis indica]